MINPKTAQKQWRRKLLKNGEIKTRAFEPYIKVLKDGLVSNPIQSKYPLNTPIFKMESVQGQFRRWVQVASKYFKGVSPHSEISSIA